MLGYKKSDAGGISIHALREEGDFYTPFLYLLVRTSFLSTPSARRATQTSDSQR